MGHILGDVADRHVLYVVEAHGRIPIEPLVLWRNLSRLVLEAPRRIGHNGSEFPTSQAT